MTHKMYTVHKRYRVLGTAVVTLALVLVTTACSRGGATPTTAPTQPAATAAIPSETEPPTATSAPTKTATPAVEPTDADQPLPNDTPIVDENSQVYTNANFGVTFLYPASWQASDQGEERYEGEDGFFQVALVGGEGLSIGEVADNEAQHKLQPYGSEPTIELLQAPGRAARLILPSDDQPADMNGQAALIVAPPGPIEYNGETYSYLVVWADQGHIRSIASSLAFMGK